jgi:hypothetical protein
MKLKKVIITHRDSCKTYVLRRIGLSNLLNMDTDTPTTKEIYTSDKFQKLQVPEKGCLIIWTHKNDAANNGYWQPHGIEEDGKIFYIRRFDYGHIAVYEGNDWVSDVSWEDGQGTIIRLRKYSELPTPDFILKWKQHK